MLGHIGLGSLKTAAILAVVISATAIAVVAAQNPEFGEFFAKSAYVLLAGEEAALETPQPESSGVLYAITLYNQDGSVAGSGIGGVDAEPGKYDARVDFFDSAISYALLNSAEVDSNVLFFDVDEWIDENAVAAPDGDYEWAHIVAVQPNVHFAYASIALRTPEGAGTLFRCDGWDFSSGKCSGAFEKIADVSGAETEVPLYLSPQAFGFAGFVAGEIAAGSAALPDANAFDVSAPAPVTAKSGKKIITMRLDKASFAANDAPVAELDLTDDKGVAVDAEVEAMLTMPDGSTRLIDAGKIKKTGTGKFSIEAPRPRSFKAGTYTLSVKATDKDGVVSEAEMSFEWGLIAVNTRKSTYRPGETAEFEIVVLDRESYGVAGAEVSMLLVSSQGLRELLSTANGLVKETASSGIYIASAKVWDIGTYEVTANAKADGIDTTIQTTFLVAQDYDYDIIRRTATKIDPAIQPIMVEIAVTALKGQESADVREFVPREFEVEPGKMLVVENLGDETVEKYVDDPKASVKESGDEKIIEWKNIEFGPGGTATVMYYYTVPDRKPWLYNLGPIEVVSPDKQSFFEARSWMIAVDQIATTVFHFRNPAEYNYSEPAPNDAISGETFVGTATMTFFGMHPSTGTTLTGVTKILGGTGTGVYKHSMFISPPLTAQSIAIANWTVNICGKELAIATDATPRLSIWVWADSNDNRAGPIVGTVTAFSGEWTAAMTRKTLTVAGSAVTINKKDKIVVEINNNGVTPGAGGTVDFNFGNAGWDGNAIFAGAAIALYAVANVPSITTPSADGNTAIYTNENFLVTASTACSSSYFDCGDTNVSIQWCSGASCSNFADANSSSGAIQLVSGLNPAKDVVFNSGDTNTSHKWVLNAIAGGTYELRVAVDGNNTDANYSSGTDRTMTIQSAADYSFSLSYPPSGCTQGKGSIDAGVTCDRAYFETTDLSGPADQNKVNPQGQDGDLNIYFFVYNNQSTGPNDLNITLDLNAALPASLRFKVSKIYAGWAGTCTGNTDVNCVNVTTTPQNVGKAVYSTGTMDLNIFIWADFIAAAVGRTDRNVNSTSIAP